MAPGQIGAAMPVVHAPYRTKQDFAYLAIKDWIVYGTLAPGERITIRDAAERLGISETPVRAALTRLESEGLVEHRSHIGATVSPVRLQDIEEAQLIVSLLQGVVAEQAALRATQKEVAEMRAILDDLDALSGTASAMDFSAQNFRFHRAITDVSGYSLIGTLQDQLFDRMDRARMIWMVESHREKARGEHRDVLDAIERKDAAAARAAMERHWIRAGKDFTAQMAELRERAEAESSEREDVHRLGARRPNRSG